MVDVNHPRRKRRAAGMPTRTEITRQSDKQNPRCQRKQIPARALAAGPSFANVALFGQYAIEQDEAHHAADVAITMKKTSALITRSGDQAAQDRGINVRKSIRRSDDAKVHSDAGY